MVNTSLGWINAAEGNAWDVFFMIYYITYLTISLILVWRWGKTGKKTGERKISLVIIVSFLAVTVTGTLTDMFGKFIVPGGMPQIAPILMLLPSVAVYYAIYRHGWLNPKDAHEDALLMSDQIRLKAVNYISASLLFAAMVGFVANFFFKKQDNLEKAVISCLIYLVMAVAVQLIHKIRHKLLRDLLMAALFASITPIISFRYYSTAGTTIWALPVVIITVSTLFEERIVQYLIYGSVMATQVFMWIFKPGATVEINDGDHMIRLSILLSAIWLASKVNRIFQNKLIENARQIEFQRITMGISNEFLGANEENWHKKMDISLSRISSSLATERIYVYMLDEDKEKDNGGFILKCRGFWSNGSLSGLNEMDKEISDKNYPGLAELMKEGHTVAYSRIEDFRSPAGEELASFLGGTDRAFASMPIMAKNKVYGFLGTDCKAMITPWPIFQLNFLKVVSLIISTSYERLLQEKEILELAYYDHLTKLPNRFLFKDRINQMLKLAVQNGTVLAVMSLDLDTFKSINDSIGHDAGDKLIVKLAERLTRALKSTDTAARLSGDDFLILLSNMPSVEHIEQAAVKILDIFRKPFVIDDQEFFITGSAGISVYPYDGSDADSLIRNAELAMYKAKETGTNSYAFCTEDMKEELLYKIKLTNNLFRVLDNKELVLYYQPQVNTHSGEIIGAEALLRWFHPVHGLIMPGLFIPLAENTGLINSIGDWVLAEACRQCKDWHNKGKLIRMAVNVSSIQLRNSDFVDRVKKILEDTELEPEYLELELTESAAVKNSEHIIDTLRQLKEMGVSISIDDFGTEYSSLSRLSSMPIDKIKLDMHFIHSIDKSHKENAIIKSVIELSHVLGLQVVAEGVETEPQLNFLKKHNNDIIQGYYFYRPIPPEELDRILLEKY